MKIIWLMPECPLPSNTGGRKVEWNKIKSLTRNNDIYLYLVVDDEGEKKYQVELEKICKEVHIYTRRSGIGILCRSLLNPYPAVSRWNNQMEKDIDQCFNHIKPDFVIVELPQMLGNLSTNVKVNARIVVEQQNVEHLSMRSIADHLTNPLKKAIYTIVSMQLKRYEDIQYRKINIYLMTFVSTEDKKYFEKRYPDIKTLYVPIGADVQDLEPIVYSKKMSFVAKMSYEPNETGAIWFEKNVWPIIISRIPDAELYLVGKDPSDKMLEESSKQKNITVTGTVDSVEPYYKESVAIIAPILSGGGVKVKLLEGLGHNKIVISTKKALEGTDFISGIHVLATDSAEEFAEYCISVINEPERYERIRMNAHEIMKNKYSWDGIMSMFEMQLRDGLDEKQSRKIL